MKKVEEVVEYVLRETKETRDSDTKLIYAVFRNMGVYKDESFASVSNKILSKQLPSYASITRAKRKVVEKHPELDCSKKVREMRNEQEEMFKAYARS